MEQNPVTFNQIASQRHLKLNACLKENVTINLVVTNKSRKRKKRIPKDKNLLHFLDTKYLSHNPRSFLHKSLTANDIFWEVKKANKKKGANNE